MRLINQVTIRKPIDAHNHFRTGSLLTKVAQYTSARYKAAIAMPNLKPVLTSIEQVRRYRDEILAASNGGFMPLMTMYLTDTLDPDEVSRACEDGVIKAVKYYPRGLTTNSDEGVLNPASLWTPGTKPYAVLDALYASGGRLLLHCANGIDKNGKELDPYDQEKDFIRETLPRILDRTHQPRTSLEHLSTREGAEFLDRNGSILLVGTMTAHHLHEDRRSMFRKGLRPNLVCWPLINREEHKIALRKLATAGHSFVFLGSDSAPHPQSAKYSECCPGGIFTAHASLELYAEVFEEEDALGDARFELFTTRNACKFYDIGLPEETVTLIREPWTVLEPLAYSEKETTSVVHPYRLGEKIRWKLKG